MGIAHVLMHSPSVGPLTWAPVAERLPGAIVPSLLHVGGEGPPFWPAVVSAVADAVRRLPEDDEVVLVAHSNAGLFVPVVVGALTRTVRGCVFVDAALPARSSVTEVASPEFLEVLRSKADAEGVLPAWTGWWDEADVAPLFPDPVTRRMVEKEQPRLPLSYYEQRIPVPDGWDRRPCGYVLFDEAYEDAAADARERGWPVEHLPGLHLHQLVDPDGVVAAIGRLSHSA
ncbi:alpha/beta hydrolase [Actinoplanes flavus]|uniref:Alpha/beta hydrolase n=1 Tax=Actinoplanes flavus TaxID=2820290 RepID=A0ABS3UZE5_9ACTN|nr:alpha/beta hydrolase [Actinoplanes flavus]MBO3743950.1 alpha/beta hydrolase [Actinoplanes flavus]